MPANPNGLWPNGSSGAIEASAAAVTRWMRAPSQNGLPHLQFR